MAFSLASLVVDIVANTHPFESALRGVRSSLSSAMSGLGGLVSKGAGVIFAPLIGAAQVLSSAWKGAFLGLAIGLGAGTAYAVDAASDLNETASKVGVVFGASAAKVSDAAEQMARDLGIPKKEFLDAAAGIGLMGKAARLTQGQAADMGISLARLGADAASFYNIRLDEALEKIRAGLAGEAEPLRTLGVMLSEAAVNAEALKLGLVRGKQELTEGQKVIARASLITKGLADANGDLIRTQDGVANRLREIQGRFQNLAADLGQYLLPAIKRLAGGFTDALAATSKFVEDNKEMFDGWASKLEEAAGVAVGTVKNWREALALAKEAAKEGGNWLVANIPAITDRIELAIKAGFEKGMEAAIKIVENKAGFIRGALQGAKAGEVGSAAGMTLPPGPRAFTPFGAPGSGFATALDALNRKIAEDKAAEESAKKGLTPQQVVDRDKAAGDLAERDRKYRADLAEAERKDRELHARAAARGLDHATPNADALRRRELEEALKRNPAEVVEADKAAAKEKKKAHASLVGDADGFDRELREAALGIKKDDTDKEILTEARNQTAKLGEIAQNTAGAGKGVTLLSTFG